MKFFRKNWSNIAIVVVLALLFIPATGTPIKIAVQRLFAGTPTELKEEDRTEVTNYNWSVTSLASEKKLFESSKNKVVLINFWATWCPPCVAEMPSLQALYTKYGSSVDFYFVSSEKPEKILKFMEDKQYTFPVYIQNTKPPAALDSNVLPTTFVISKNGKIVVNETGAANWNSEKMNQLLDTLLLEQ